MRDKDFGKSLKLQPRKVAQNAVSGNSIFQIFRNKLRISKNKKILNFSTTKKAKIGYFSCEYCGFFKITSFEEHMRTATSIRYYFDTINLKQSGFCKTCSFKIVVSDRKYKNYLKNCESQKKNFFLQFLCNVYVMFYYEIPWFHQDFNGENLRFLNLYSVHAARILDLSLEIMLSPPK